MSNAGIETHVEIAKAAGFTTAAKRAGEDYELGTKLQRAHAAFQSITQAQVDKFNTDLKKKTETTDKNGRRTWKELAFQPIAEYPSLPPIDVMQQVKTAKEMGVFDHFQVAYIADREKRKDPDPIVFGTVNNSTDRFFIAQWGEDVKIADLLGVPQ